MGNGLLASMAITDALEIQNGKNAIYERDRIIAAQNKEIQSLIEDNAGNLFEKIVLRRELGKLYPYHPLLDRNFPPRLQAKAAKIINSKGADWDDVRNAALNMKKEDFQTSVFSLPPDDTFCLMPPNEWSEKWLATGGKNEELKTYATKKINPEVKPFEDWSFKG